MKPVPELRELLELTRRVGNDPLLTQASTGNCSAKLDGVLWVKASGKWMADAMSGDFLIPLDLAEVRTECLGKHIDPSAGYPGASLETALHATLPHRMALHLHCVDTIAWAVRSDAPMHLKRLLEGLAWQWIPYVASGLPLARKIEQACAVQPETNLFVLGNHGLVLCGEDAEDIDGLLSEARRRLAIAAREPHPADYAALMEVSMNSHWDLPEDDAVHALGTDAISRSILAGGMLFPCQAIFSDSGSVEVFRPIAYPFPGDDWQHRYADRPFLILEGRGVVVSRTIAPGQLAMISGLAQVVQRLGAGTSLRYLTDGEIAGMAGETAYRYRELASAGHGVRNGAPAPRPMVPAMGHMPAGRGKYGHYDGGAVEESRCESRGGESASGLA